MRRRHVDGGGGGREGGGDQRAEGVEVGEDVEDYGVGGEVGDYWGHGLLRCGSEGGNVGRWEGREGGG